MKFETAKEIQAQSSLYYSACNNIACRQSVISEHLPCSSKFYKANINNNCKTKMFMNVTIEVISAAV